MWISDEGCSPHNHSGTQCDGGPTTWIIIIHYGREEGNIENCVPAPKLFGGLGDTITFAYGLLTRTSHMIHFTARKWRTYGST